MLKKYIIMKRIVYYFFLVFCVVIGIIFGVFTNLLYVVVFLFRENLMI